MSMNDVFRISSSALTAQSLRLNTTASNLANAESAAGPAGKVYRAKQVGIPAQPTGNRSAEAGVSVALLGECTDEAARACYPTPTRADARR